MKKREELCGAYERREERQQLFFVLLVNRVLGFSKVLQISFKRFKKIKEKLYFALS
jgi:hypothetical protein